MPVNSFENYPMNWKPDKELLKFPVYISLAELLEQDIMSGRLPANTQLPPQRELADFLDVNLSTITRAFKRCETKGLIYAIIGKGTFVSPNAALPVLDIPENHPYIELGPIRPYYQFNADVADAARRILQGTYSDKLFEFELTSGNNRHRKIAATWLAEFQITTSDDHIILASGTQNALAIALLSLFKALVLPLRDLCGLRSRICTFIRTWIPLRFFRGGLSRGRWPVWCVMYTAREENLLREIRVLF